MTNNDQIPSEDFVIRVYVLSHMFHDVCRCHLFTDPTIRCSRCDILTRAMTAWPYEYRLTFESYNKTKSEAAK